MARPSIRFSSFPRTDPPPDFVGKVVGVFTTHEKTIGTLTLPKGLTSDEALAVIRDDLVALGFAVEHGKTARGKIDRPVFFGEGGQPTLRYQIDAYHEGWRCGLEVEAGRAWMGNAVYRDLIQAMVMVQVDHLCLAVPLSYRYKTGGRTATSQDYKNTVEVAEALYGHDRVRVPYGLTIIGY